MQYMFHIGETADLLQVSRSKLRFWEQQGLLQLERNQENNYRQYSFLDVLHIIDIIFYRELHFSAKELEVLFQMSAGELEQELEQKQQEIEQEIEELRQTKNKIALRRSDLQEAVRLQQQPYQFGRPDVWRIRPVYEEHQEDWRRALLDPYSSVGFQQTGDDELQYCLLAEAGEPCLWQQKEEQRYVEVLVRFMLQDSQVNNVAEHCQQLQEMGWQTGCIISRYLFTSVEEGIRYDYYKSWIEVM